MAKYEYEETVSRSIEVPGCPLCGSEDLKFWNYNRDCSMHGAAAGVKCKRCGHEVKVDGNELHMDWGEDCQREAIEEWKYQVARWGKNKPEVKPDVKKLEKQLKALEAENAVLKTVISLEGFTPQMVYADYEAGIADLKKKFFDIMAKFKESRLNVGPKK